MERQIHLSKRLKMLANMVSEGNRVADVGCDHGYLPIFLMQHGRIPGALAMDVRKGPLKAAREHIASCRLEDYIECRLSDGLKAYIAGEADTIICAGMGGRLMERILTEGMDKAKAADIPVIFFNREVSDAVVNSYEKCAFIGTDAAEAGHMQGQMIADYLLANYDDVDLNGDGTISYVMFKGQNANPEAEYRTQYAVEDCDAALEAAGKPALTFYDANNADKFLVDRNGTWSAQASNEYMTTILSEYTEANNNMVELVICNNDGMAEGAITALKTAGYNASADKAIPVFGVDATDAAKELIAAGSMVGSIKQDAEGMAAAIALLAKNATSGAALMDGTDSYNVDDASAKIRIPYAVYTG